MNKFFKYSLFVMLFSLAFLNNASAVTLTSPKSGDTYKTGRSIALAWETTNNQTLGKVFRFSWAGEPNPVSWTNFLVRLGTNNYSSTFRDGTTTPIGTVNVTMPNLGSTSVIYLKMENVADANDKSIVGPITVTVFAPATVDSTLKGNITGTVTLSNKKMYGLDGVLYVQDGGVLRIEPGTVIRGDNQKVSAVVVNRGGKIYAKGTAQRPIVMTSGAPTGSRDRGDWGGLLVMGRARVNQGLDNAIEGGIADASTVKKNGWYGGNDDADSSGVLSYVRVEFAGIAESPDNELNGITFGAVGNRTVVDHVQVSYSGDDSFEWFGGTVNSKYLIAYNGIDDDFDTDFGYSGKNQFGISKRFNDIADVSNSEAFESDNDGSTSDLTPFTSPVFSNYTIVGPIADTSWARWSSGQTYDNKYNPRYLAAAQIRRNSRMSLINSVIVGWPAGIEIQSNKTVGALNTGLFDVKNNDLFGIKGDKYIYGGSSTTLSGSLASSLLGAWLTTNSSNTFNATGSIATYANLENPFANGSAFNPAPKATATNLTTGNFVNTLVAADSFFDKVTYRGAMNTQRWDAEWAEYDPINKDYKPVTPDPIYNLKINTPKANDSFKYGRVVNVSWDTTGQFTRGKTFRLSWAESADAANWTNFLVRIGTNNYSSTFRDGTTTATGNINITMPSKATTNLYVRMQEVSGTMTNTVGPITVNVFAPATVDSTLKGDITGTVTLSNKKMYGLDGVLYVQDGGVLRIEPGTVIKGDNQKVSAVVVNRGGKIYAKGTAQLPIVMTSGAPAGSRDRGDWGGLLVMGRAKVNQGLDNAIEGGIADASTVKKNGWYGGNDDADSSGVLSYVRVEFAGIAESPDNELNGITFGAVGSKTVVDHVQVSYSGDDSFEWFGGTVNSKYLIAYNGIDDDFDTDFGYTGKNQFGISKRFNDIADVSNSEAFESDNDGSTSDLTPFTAPVFSNYTVIGPLADTSWARWSSGQTYDNKYNPRYLAAAQIRRNSRMTLSNSVIVGWPAGIEIQSNKTVGALDAGTFDLKNNSIFGIKGDKYLYAGSSTTFSGNFASPIAIAAWVIANGHTLSNGTGDIATYSNLTAPFAKGADFNPAPTANASYLTTAGFTGKTDDSFFEKVAFRGAMGTQRWDAGWAEYDPINKDYKPVVAEPIATLKILNPKAGDTYKFGKSVNVSWDTTGQITRNKVFRLSWAESADATNWTNFLVRLGNNNFSSTFRDGTTTATGNINVTMPNKATTSLYVRMQEVSGTLTNTVGPITVNLLAPAPVDSTLKGDITGTVSLSNTKMYGLDGVLYVQDGGVLRIEPGTVIRGDNQKVSAVVINRGGKIYAKGTKQQPIVFTSGAPAGSRDRGDWGGLLIMGRAKVNQGLDNAIEGGIADASTVKKNGWYGGNDDADSSGVLSYVRVEFAGIAESPDNELNGITLGAVGNRTVIDHVQVSYSGDDSFEWFGGTVNSKYIIAYNGIDDDFDTDFGYTGKNQFGISKRFNDIADVSNSEAFESDNDGSTSDLQPFTAPVFSNFTVVGPLADTSWARWSAGQSYDNKYNPRYLAAAQIRRNSRMTLSNSVIVGWPAGIEIQSNKTMGALDAGTFDLKNNSIYGIKGDKYLYAGSSTTFSGIFANPTAIAAWVVSNGHSLANGSGSISIYANLVNPFEKGTNFNPAPNASAPYLTTAGFTGKTADSFFEKVAYRGAMGPQRWDTEWTEYDPINKEYKATSVESDFRADFKYEVTPSVATNYAEMTYTLPSNSTVTINFYDATGALTSNLINNQLQEAGQYEYGITTEDLANGIYFVSITTDFGTFTRRLIVNR